jgi:cyanophycinase-like exopeptidase
MAPSLRAVHLAQQMLGFAVDEMQPSASLTGDGFIFVVGRIFIVVQPVLDLPVCRRTREHKVGHPWRCPRYRFERA